MFPIEGVHGRRVLFVTPAFPPTTLLSRQFDSVFHHCRARLLHWMDAGRKGLTEGTKCRPNTRSTGLPLCSKILCRLSTCSTERWCQSKSSTAMLLNIHCTVSAYNCFVAASVYPSRTTIATGVIAHIPKEKHLWRSREMRTLATTSERMQVERSACGRSWKTTNGELLSEVKPNVNKVETKRGQD